MEELFEKLRVFVASPSDVGAERARVNRVVDRLNRTGGAAHEHGMVLEVLRWETHVAPLLGQPEEVILDQLPTKDWDIFVGILWSRFGSPTGTRNTQSGYEYESGTEQEFDLAYRSALDKGRPEILLYRCIQVPTDRLDQLDTDQLLRVGQFFRQLETQGKVLYLTFSQWEDFESRLEQDLTRVLQRLRKKAQPSPSRRRQDQTSRATSPSSLLAKDLEEGIAYEVAFSEPRYRRS